MLLVVSEGPILFCYDGSPESRRAIEETRGLLAPRAAVVITVGPLEAVSEVYAAAGSGAARYERELYEGLLELAEEGVEVARAEGFAAEARAELDVDVWRSIVDVANELDASVIVLGSRGLHGLREIVDGNVAHLVARHAHRPVLVIPPVVATREHDGRER
jgi:nucleotide-binding universal stress UspA family protein